MTVSVATYFYEKVKKTVFSTQTEEKKDKKDKKKRHKVSKIVQVPKIYYFSTNQFNNRSTCGIGVERYYLAYGSNMDLTQMAHRCPNAKFVGTGVIHDYRLIFKRTYATIKYEKHSDVPIVVYLISKEDEKRLDRYEGYPKSYYKHFINLSLNGSAEKGMVYIMSPHNDYKLPSDRYYNLLSNAYDRFALDRTALEGAVEYTKMNLPVKVKN